jgi:hypothetical protein
LRADDPVFQLEEGRQLRERQAEQAQECGARQRNCERRVEFALAFLDELVDQRGRVGADRGHELSHFLAREERVEQAPVAGLSRRIDLLRDHRPLVAERHLLNQLG